MSMIEVINEIKQNLEDMREAKRGIKEALENKFKKPIGDDFTKYPQMINEVWIANEKIQIGEDAVGTFANPAHMSNHLFDFSNTKKFSNIVFNEAIQYGKLPELKEKIEINIRHFDKTYTVEQMFGNVGNSGNPDVSKWFRVIGIPRFTDDITTFFLRVYSYADWMPFFDNAYEIDEELDCKGRVFSLNNEMFNYTDLSKNTHLPKWFCQIFPYCSYFGNVINKTCDLTEDIELIVAKEKTLTNTSDRAWFTKLTAPNIHIYAEHDFITNTNYNIFYNNTSANCLGCPGILRIDGPGRIIFNSKTNGNTTYVKNRIASPTYPIGRLEVKLCISNISQLDQDFSNCKDIEFLDGSEWYSISNLPFKTQDEWINFFNSLPDNSLNTTHQNIIKIASEYYNLLDEEDILIATEKGYTITSV